MIVCSFWDCINKTKRKSFSVLGAFSLTWNTCCVRKPETVSWRYIDACEEATAQHQGPPDNSQVQKFKPDYSQGMGLHSIFLTDSFSRWLCSWPVTKWNLVNNCKTELPGSHSDSRTGETPWHHKCVCLHLPGLMAFLLYRRGAGTHGGHGWCWHTGQSCRKTCLDTHFLPLRGIRSNRIKDFCVKLNVPNVYICIGWFF